MLTRKSLLIHVPHASTEIPERYRSAITLSDAALQAEHDILTDWHMDKLFDKSIDSVVFPYSRLLCDVERYADDSNEPMAALGMGFCYTKTHSGEELRPYNEDERAAALREFYTSHHEKLSQVTQKIIDEQGFCILIDCHSYNDTVPWVAGKECPDICLGLNALRADVELAVAGLCAEFGYSFAVNEPFAGSIVPNDVDESKLFSVMLEINKRVYGGKEVDWVKFERLQAFTDRFVQLLICLL